MFVCSFYLYDHFSSFFSADLAEYAAHLDEIDPPPPAPLASSDGSADNGDSVPPSPTPGSAEGIPRRARSDTVVGDDDDDDTAGGARDYWDVRNARTDALLDAHLRAHRRQKQLADLELQAHRQRVLRHALSRTSPHASAAGVDAAQIMAADDRLAASCRQETRTIFIPGFDARGEEATSKKQTLRLRESDAARGGVTTAAVAVAAAAAGGRSSEESAAITASLRRSYALAIETLGVAAPRLRVRFTLHVDGDERPAAARRGKAASDDGAGEGAGRVAIDAGRHALDARTLEDVALDEGAWSQLPLTFCANPSNYLTDSPEQIIRGLALDEALDLRCPAKRRAAHGAGPRVTPFFDRPGAPARAAWDPRAAVGLRVGVRWSNGVYFTGIVVRYDAKYVRPAAAARAAAAASGATAAAAAASSAGSDAAADTSGAAWKCFQVTVRAERCSMSQLAPLVRDERIDARGGRSYGFTWRERGWADEAEFTEELDAASLTEGRDRAVVAHHLSLAGAEQLAVALYCRGVGAVVHGPSRAAPVPLLVTSSASGAHFVQYDDGDTRYVDLRSELTRWFVEAEQFPVAALPALPRLEGGGLVGQRVVLFDAAAGAYRRGTVALWEPKPPPMPEPKPLPPPPKPKQTKRRAGSVPPGEVAWESERLGHAVVLEAEGALAGGGAAAVRAAVAGVVGRPHKRVRRDRSRSSSASGAAAAAAAPSLPTQKLVVSLFYVPLQFVRILLTI